MTLWHIGFIFCLLSALALTIDVSLPSSRECLSWPDRQTPALKEEIDNLFAATNQVRAEKGRSMLQKDANLMGAAQQYADLMAAQDEMSHTLNGLTLVDKAKRVGYAYRKLSENIALNTDLNGRFVVYEQWMKSKGHRQNLLAADVSQIGVGIAGPSKGGRRYYYCQIFGAPL